MSFFFVYIKNGQIFVLSQTQS